MHIDAFIQRFSAQLEAMEALPLPRARHAYDILCRTFAPSDPAGMRIKDGTVDGIDVRHFIPRRCFMLNEICC